MPLNEYEFPTSKLSNVQSQLEKLVEKNYYLHQSAKEAFRWGAHARLLAGGRQDKGGPAGPLLKQLGEVPTFKASSEPLLTMLSGPRPLPPCRSYILAYNSHHLKDTFNVHSLDLKAVARSFGFSSPPRVNINIESKAAHTRKAQKTGGQGADYRRMKTGGCGQAAPAAPACRWVKQSPNSSHPSKTCCCCRPQVQRPKPLWPAAIRRQPAVCARLRLVGKRCGSRGMGRQPSQQQHSMLPTHECLLCKQHSCAQRVMQSANASREGQWPCWAAVAGWRWWAVGGGLSTQAVQCSMHSYYLAASVWPGGPFLKLTAGRAPGSVFLGGFLPSLATHRIGVEGLGHASFASARS